MYLKFDVENFKDDLFCMENDFLYDVEADDLYSKAGGLKIYFSEVKRRISSRIKSSSNVFLRFSNALRKTL